ncbi:MAG: hypothetical protein GY845_15715 [Planctomycetes bacterium]|nr:hypothetical protein [Planctomycetota bacterium]
MKKINKVYRWFPLLIGICLILIVSALLTWEDKTMHRWSFVNMWLVTASGPFGGIITLTSPDARGKAFLMGALNLLALLAYSIKPSKYTMAITVIGFIWWQFMGWAMARMGI